MRIPKSWVPVIARRVVDALVSEDLVILEVDREKLVAEVEALMTQELEVEDRINDEVREVLKKFDREIESGRLDYRKLFDMTKQKIVKDRNVVI